MQNTASCTAIVVLCTAPDERCAQQLATDVLNAGLAACVTLLPGAYSFYVWEGKLDQQKEVQLVIKSDLLHQNALLQRLKQQHPYQTPELLVVPISDGDKDYLTWLTASLR
ncbi:MAG: divalent cation tolerance protein CutA [Symbiopectobacterium sp.]|uniref:divalent cation tolerance protein CutA n=1 Tax=Symbiopectobacterium sp. TaxID=2952789 RepID=UPI0039E9F0B2